jgi:DNA repair exonuclease SbcCD ATPase subunit
VKRCVLLVLFVLLSTTAVGALQADRSSYDPMAHERQTKQQPGIIESTLAGINPKNRDYGAQVGESRKQILEDTLHQVYFWGLILLAMGLGISVTGNGWLLRERERRLTISADVVTQLFNAYIGSRAKALEVIIKHNVLVDRYNTLDGEKQRLADQIRELSHKPVQSELDFSQVREGRGTVDQTESSPATIVPNDSQEHEVEHPEVENLRAQLADVETKLQRKTAQLQAKDNQITNLRERLSRAHDSLEAQRSTKPAANQPGANG